MTDGKSRGRSATRMSRPYYDKVEQLIGVCGGTDDSDALPGSKFLLPAPPPRCGERLLQQAFGKVNIPIVAVRRANMTKPVRGFPACHYCGNCGQGCDTASFFNSADHLLPFALKTGRLELRSNAVVARVLVDDRGLAEGVQYFDRKTGREERVYGKVVIMGASAVDTTRILLNSKSDRHPNGLGNGSDVIGRYLCEQIRVHARGFLPQLFGQPARNDRGIGGEHIYMPRFTHRLKNPGFIRGYQMQFWNTGSQPTNLPGMAKRLPGFGADFKRDVKRHYPAWVELHPFGETLPYANNRITVDPAKPDRYGTPMLHIEYAIGDNERKMAEHIFDTLEEVGKAAGIEWVRLPARRARQQRLRHPRARVLPHGRRPEALGPERVQPDARGEERVRRRRLGLHERQREEPDADHPLAVVARDGLSGGGDEEGESLRRRFRPD